ncbi:MAG: hypothetical protein ACTHKR_09400 [Sphingomonas sp.]
MKTFLKKATLGVALGAATLAMAATPAEAQRYRHYGHYHHGDTTGAAILGGLVGLGVGAAIASDHRDRYYDDGYYAPPPPPPPGYYGDGYYEYRYDYRPRCYVQDRWDPYYGRHVRVRVCR